LWCNKEELKMTEEHMKVIEELRDLGYAVCIFNPEELNGAKPHKVEDELVSAGWDIIDNLATDEGEKSFMVWRTNGEEDKV
jgi:hypothetical protein